MTGLVYVDRKKYKKFNNKQLNDAKTLTNTYKKFLPFVSIGSGAKNENPNFQKFLKRTSYLSTKQGKKFHKDITYLILWDDENGIHRFINKINQPFIDYFIKNGIEYEKYSSKNTKLGKIKYPMPSKKNVSDEKVLTTSLVFAENFWRQVDTKKAKAFKKSLSGLKTTEAKKVAAISVKLLRQLYKNVKSLEMMVQDEIDDIEAI